MRINFVFVDYENVQVKSLELLKPEHFRVIVFLGPNNTKLPIDLVMTMQKLGNRASYIALDTPGNNALDFHIAYYVGVKSEKEPTAYFHLISKDTGFDPLVKHLRSKGISCTRSISIEAMPCFPSEALAVNVEQNKVHSELVSLPKTVIVKELTIDDLVKLAVDDLISRKNSKPRAVKTLRSTIQAKLGKNTSNEKIDAVYSSLIKKGFIKVNGTKISYSLPTN